MNALTEAVVEWVQGERIPQTRFSVIAELRTLANHCTSWPNATISQLNQAIDEAIKQNLITESDGVLRVVAVDSKRTTARQQELF